MSIKVTFPPPRNKDSKISLEVAALPCISCHSLSLRLLAMEGQAPCSQCVSAGN